MKDKTNRTRRGFTTEFKASAVRLVIEGGESVAEAAATLGASESAVDKWVRADRAAQVAAPTALAESEEVRRLRKQTRESQMEVEILKKATAFFAKRGS